MASLRLTLLAVLFCFIFDTRLIYGDGMYYILAFFFKLFTNGKRDATVMWP
jgi:hypothetical protein